MSNNNFQSSSGLKVDSPVFTPASHLSKFSGLAVPVNLSRKPITKFKRTPLTELNKHPIFNFCQNPVQKGEPLESEEPEESEEQDNLIINPSDLLPDFHEFRALALSVAIPSDFHRMVKEVLLIVPIIQNVAECYGKIYGGLLREMIWISFQSLNFKMKVEKLVNYLTQNQTNIWIPSRFSGSESPSANRGESLQVIHCPKTKTYHQIIVSRTFSNIVDATINSLVLSFFSTYDYKLNVRGSGNDLSTTLDDIRKRRLHLITLGIENTSNFSQLMIRASVLFQNGWKPLNLEDQELIRCLFQNSSPTLILRDHLNPLLRKNKTKRLSSYIIYTLLLTYYPNLTKAINLTNHSQIKVCYLLAIMNNDLFNLINLEEISDWSDVRFALYIAAEIGSRQIFGFFYRKLELIRNPISTQKCLVIALLHDNLEVINYINTKRVYLPKNCQILFPKSDICWHQHRENAPCNFKEIASMINQIKINSRNRCESQG